ncbi:MAG: AAA family ATPase, partial [Idiomarina sp.]|nr:AAA family ATPase [Idiomarina sp.]
EDTELTRSVCLPVTVSVCVFFLAAAALSYWQMGGSL